MQDTAGCVGGDAKRSTQGLQGFCKREDVSGEPWMDVNWKVSIHRIVERDYCHSRRWSNSGQIDFDSSTVVRHLEFPSPVGAGDDVCGALPPPKKTRYACSDTCAREREQP